MVEKKSNLFENIICIFIICSVPFIILTTFIQVALLIKLAVTSLTLKDYLFYAGVDFAALLVSVLFLLFGGIYLEDKYKKESN